MLQDGTYIPLVGFGFRVHFLIFLACGVVLMALNFAYLPDKIIFHWPLMIWAAGIALHSFMLVRRLTKPYTNAPTY